MVSFCNIDSRQTPHFFYLFSENIQDPSSMPLIEVISQNSATTPDLPSGPAKTEKTSFLLASLVSLNVKHSAWI